MKRGLMCNSGVCVPPIVLPHQAAHFLVTDSVLLLPPLLARRQNNTASSFCLHIYTDGPTIKRPREAGSALQADPEV